MTVTSLTSFAYIIVMQNKFSIEDYFQRLVVFPGPALSPDGTRLAYVSSVTGQPQVWLAQVTDDGLLYPRPITYSKTEQPNIFEQTLLWINDHRLAILMDQHGDELTYIRIIDFKTGGSTVVDQTPGARSTLGYVSDDRKTLYFQSNKDHRTTVGLFSYDLKSGATQKIHQDESYSSFWMTKQKFKGRLLFGKQTTATNASLHSVHPKTGEVRDLFSDPKSRMLAVAEAELDELLVTTDHGREFLSLAFFNVKTKEIRYIGRDQWDCEQATLSPDKKSLAVLRNVAGHTELDLYAWPSLKLRAAKVIKRGVVENFSFSKDGRSAILSRATAIESREYLRLDLKSLDLQPLTNNHVSRIPKSALVEPQLIKYRSDTREIHSWLFLPKTDTPNSKVPVIVFPHGGPQWQERATYRPVLQYLIGRGFAVWAPNPTGSTGYGKSCYQAIEGQWGTADLPDMINGIEWLKSSGLIDPQKIGIMGGSYGGYMTLRSITRIPKTFKAAVDIFGVSNLFSFVATVPEDWKPYMNQLVGDPVADKERMTEQSPIFSLDRVDCPLLVIQGALDARVAKAESDQVVETLQKMGKPVEYVVFEDEGHGFLKLENELRAYKAAADFLVQHLLNDTSTTAQK